MLGKDGKPVFGTMEMVSRDERCSFNWTWNWSYRAIL
jgi:hypothetical protein